MIQKICKFISSIIKSIIIDSSERNFMRHNNVLFNNPQNKNNKILIETHQMQPNYMPISHFSKVLNKIHGSQLVGYQTQIHFNIFNNIYYLFKSSFPLTAF